MSFGYVPPPIPHHLIGDCERLLAPAADRANHDLAEVWPDVASGRAQLWVVRDETVTTAVITTMQDDDCTIWLMGGRLKDIHWLTTIEKAAREGGAKAMLIIGRKGWGRLLHGYHRTEIEGLTAFRKAFA